MTSLPTGKFWGDPFHKLQSRLGLVEGDCIHPSHLTFDGFISGDRISRQESMWNMWSASKAWLYCQIIHFIFVSILNPLFPYRWHWLDYDGVPGNLYWWIAIGFEQTMVSALFGVFILEAYTGLGLEWRQLSFLFFIYWGITAGFFGLLFCIMPEPSGDDFWCSIFQCIDVQGQSLVRFLLKGLDLVLLYFIVILTSWILRTINRHKISRRSKKRLRELAEPLILKEKQSDPFVRVTPGFSVDRQRPTSISEKTLRVNTWKTSIRNMTFSNPIPLLQEEQNIENKHLPPLNPYEISLQNMQSFNCKGDSVPSLRTVEEEDGLLPKNELLSSIYAAFLLLLYIPVMLFFYNQLNGALKLTSVSNSTIFALLFSPVTSLLRKLLKLIGRYTDKHTNSVYRSKVFTWEIFTEGFGACLYFKSYRQLIFYEQTRINTVIFIVSHCISELYVNVFVVTRTYYFFTITLGNRFLPEFLCDNSKLFEWRCRVNFDSCIRHLIAILSFWKLCGMTFYFKLVICPVKQFATALPWFCSTHEKAYLQSYISCGLEFLVFIIAIVVGRKQKGPDPFSILKCIWVSNSALLLSFIFMYIRYF